MRVDGNTPEVVDDSEYKRLCAQPNVMRRDYIRATAALLREDHAELAARLSGLLRGKAHGDTQPARMSLSTTELSERLGYPAVWHERGLYLDALYRVQLAAFVSEAEGHGVPLATYRPTAGSEHYRYGAFGFWLQRGPGPEIVDALMEAAIADPDPRWPAPP